MTARIDVTLGTFVEATQLSDKFNLVADTVKGRDKIRAIVEQAVDFITDSLPKLTDGWAFSSANPYDWDEPWLDIIRAKEIAEKPFPADLAELDDVQHLSSLKVDQKTKAKVANIKSAFGLSCEADAVRLSVAAYKKLKDLLWRENTVYFIKDQKRSDFDSKPHMKFK